MGIVSRFREYDLASDVGKPIGGLAKRSFDIMFSATALISLLPLFLLIAGLLRIFGNGPAFFVHQRVGLHEKAFGCIKFRTMVVDAEVRLEELLASDSAARQMFERDQKLKDDPRIIPVIGKFLRSTSLDELPQFINVLLGDMSVVGPRPVTQAEFERYGSVRSQYASVRPGVTGLWQVSGRSDTTFDERIAIDKTYTENWSMMQDIAIIFKTLEVVTTRRGAY